MSERDGIQIEMKKNSLKQLQSGDWIVSFTASQIDFPTELATSAMGQRFMAVLVPLGDFEDVPTSQKPENKHKLSQQAAMLCNDGRAHRFFATQHAIDWDFWIREEKDGNPNNVAAHVVRGICGVESRAELDTNTEAAARWRNLKAEYEGWLLT
jgi:hypothetical protein